MIELLKEMRQQCHALSATTDNHVPSSVHILDFQKSLKLGRAWMGKLLGILGESTPYKKDGKRHSPTDIEPVADVSSTYANISKLNQVERVDWLREQLATLIDTFDRVLDGESTTSVSASTCLISVYQHLAEARFHLGFELGRIRDSA